MTNTERIQAHNAELREAIEMAESLPDVGEGGEPTPTQEKTIDITENGTHTVIPDDGYALSKVTANVSVPIPEGYIQPSGTLEVTENGTFDVTDKASVNVNVPTGGGGGEVAPPTTPTDGKTRVYIHLEYGRTSPMLGVCPKGTVTVDWGDGTKPDTLTGTSTTTVKWTPTHEYTAPGEYVIALTVEGTMGFYGNGSSNHYSGILRNAGKADNRNLAYQNAVQKVEIGEGVTSIGGSAFQNCSSLASIAIPGGVTSIGNNAFQNCYSLASITIPEGVTSIGGSAFFNCSSLASITIPEGATSIGNSAFAGCSSLANITIPESVTSIGNNAFQSCLSLASITIPEGVTSIGGSAFYSCPSLASIAIPESVTSIGGATFQNCSSMRYYDFTAHASVPALSSTNAFSGIPSDCQMLIPAALYDEWSAATNWVTYAKYMVAV